MSLEIVEKVIERFGEQYCLHWYNGGEPLLHDEFITVSNMIKDTDSCVSTNFSLPLSDEKLDSLNNFRIIYISLSGMTPDVYRIYHRGGDFELVMANIHRFLAQQRTKICVRWLHHKYNVHEQEIARDFCSEHGLEFVLLKLNVGVEELLAGYEHDLYVKTENPPGHPNYRSCNIINWIPIGHDGRYYLCCASYKVDAGYTVFDDITVPELIRKRTKLPLCRRCRRKKLWRYVTY